MESYIFYMPCWLVVFRDQDQEFGHASKWMFNIRLDQLNQVVIRQKQQLDMLVRQIITLRQRIPEAGSGVPSRAQDDLPPHH